jgi:hypothetical protein
MVETATSTPASVEAPPSVADLPAPRRVAIATLYREARRTARELAALYAGFARHTPIAPLRAAADTLATLKAAHATALGNLAPLLDPEGVEGRGPLATPAVREPDSRPEFFAQASEAERIVAAALREIRALLGDPARCPGLQPLAAEAARHRSLLRDLYLRYS